MVKFYMSYISRVLIVAILGALSCPAFAADLNIGVVNVAKLLAEAPQAKSSMQSLQDEFEPRLRTINGQEDELKALAETLQKDLAVMGEDERRDAERSIREKQRDLARTQDEYLKDFNMRRNEEQSKILRSLMEEVESFAQSQNYDLIIGEGVLYANNLVDVTEQVLAGLQSRYESGQ